MRRYVVIGTAILMLVVVGACRFKPSAEDQAAIDALQAESRAVKAEVAAADQKNASLAGGLVKALIEARLEALKLTDTLIQQRIHAIESGARITASIPATQPDAKLAESLELEIRKQESDIKTAQQEASQYTGGLVGAMKSATVATQEQALAMLRSRYLSAKYGLPSIAAGATSATSIPPQTQTGQAAKPDADRRAKDPVSDMIAVRLLRKRLNDEDYQKFVAFDVEFTAQSLEKPARAIKGILHLQDLFGDPKMNLNWSIDEPLAPGATVLEKGVGFKYNQFMSEHQWVSGMALDKMTASFTVKSILYADGTRQDF